MATSGSLGRKKKKTPLTYKFKRKHQREFFEVYFGMSGKLFGAAKVGDEVSDADPRCKNEQEVKQEVTSAAG